MNEQIDLNKIQIAIVRNGGEKLGNCYHQHNYLVYHYGNPDITTYDSVMGQTAKERQAEIINMLPASNGGCGLEKFEPVPNTSNIFVAKAWNRIDSGD